MKKHKQLKDNAYDLISMVRDCYRHEVSDLRYDIEEKCYSLGTKNYYFLLGALRIWDKVWDDET